LTPIALLDWVFAGVLLASMLLGGWRGFVYEVMSLVAWLTAFVVARWMGPDVAQQLPMQGASAMLRQMAGFLIVFVGSLMLGSLLAVLIKKLLAKVGLRPVDRLLGAIFGLARGLLLLLLVTALLQLSPAKDSDVWQQSTAVGLASSLLRYLKSALPQELRTYLPA
jgi:membrane protein required for colicin V production